MCKFKIAKIGSLLLVVIISISCKKAAIQDKTIVSYEFSNADKNWFFYKIGDSLHYKNTDNEKITYVVTATKELKCPGYATTWRDFENELTYYESHYFITLTSTNATNFGQIEIEAVKAIPAISQRANPPSVEGRFSIIADWANWNGNNRNRKLNLKETVYENIDTQYGNINAALNICANYIINVQDYNPVIKAYYSPTKGFVSFQTFDGKIWNRVL